MQDKPEKKAPRTLRLNARDNVIVAIDTVMPGVTVQGVTAAARVMRGHKMAAAADRQGPAGPQVRPDHRLCHRGHRARQPRAHAQLLVRRVRARLCLRRRTRKRRAAAAARGARHLRRLPPRQRQGRHAQLHRHPHQRELLGLGRRASWPRPSTAPASSSSTPTSTASSRSCTAPAAASPARARATRRSSARSGAMPAIPTSPPRWSSGLGCEVFQIARLKEKYGLIEGDNFRTMTIQDTGGTKKTIEAGVARIKEMLPRANAGAAARPSPPAS